MARLNQSEIEAKLKANPTLIHGCRSARDFCKRIIAEKNPLYCIKSTKEDLIIWNNLLTNQKKQR